MIGVITLWRDRVAAFDERTVELVTTFAAQGAIAIQNVQLFVSLQQRERELEVAGRHKSGVPGQHVARAAHAAERRDRLLDVLLERMFGELNERQEEYVRDIRDSGRHLLELINEILDLSKVGGADGARGRRALLPDLLEHGLAMVRERAARHRIAIALEVAPEVGVVWADELKLKQVVLNLLTNAVKFARRRIGRRDGRDRRRRGAGDRARHRGRHREAEQERIFEAFQRGGREARAEEPGSA